MFYFEKIARTSKSAYVLYLQNTTVFMLVISFVVFIRCHLKASPWNYYIKPVLAQWGLLDVLSVDFCSVVTVAYFHLPEIKKKDCHNKGFILNSRSSVVMCLTNHTQPSGSHHLCVFKHAAKGVVICIHTCLWPGWLVWCFSTFTFSTLSLWFQRGSLCSVYIHCSQTESLYCHEK